MHSGFGPTVPFCAELHSRKYCQPGETFREFTGRVAAHLKDDDHHFHRFRDVLLGMEFMPGGRVQSAAGSPRRVTAFNCFVSGTIHDSFVHGGPQDCELTHGPQASIMGRAVEAATTMRMGGGIGYDFSTLRPRGADITKLASRSCGPVGFMPIYSAVALATSSTDHRRGAQMGVLRVDHPDIEEFVRAKSGTGELKGFNLSIAVTHEFMEAKAAGRPFDLRFDGRTYKTIDPVALWETIMRATWDYAEPGVLFIDTINDWNNLYYCETIAATNPCGEQPLPPYGACLLGSYNLVKFVRRGPMGFWFDFDRLREIVPAVTRAMDNVVDRTVYPLDRHELEARRKRRMGMGFTGLANAAEALGFPYGSPAFLRFEEEVGRIIRDESYRASVALAQEKGAFPYFDADKFLAGKFVQTLPDDIRWGIRKYGIRNSHLTSIAPTGTISLAADNVSSGLEPVFAYEFDRTEQRFDGPVVVSVQDYGVREFGIKGRRCSDIGPEEHVKVLATAQRTVDSSCSKTCNMDPGMDWDRFKGIYDLAYESGCKGITTYTPNGNIGAVLEAKREEPAQADMFEGMSCEVDPATGRRSCE